MEKNNIFPIDKSYLHFSLKCLSFLGVWNPYKKGLKYWIYQAYWAYVVNVIMAMRLMNTIVLLINAENSLQFLQQFSLFCVITANIIIYIAFLSHRVEVWKLAGSFNWERYLPGTEEITHYRNRVLANGLRTSKTFTMSIGFAVIPYFIFSYYAIFCEADYEVGSLPIFRVAPMKYSLILTNFWVAFVIDYIYFVVLGLIAVIHNAFIMSVMINVKGQFKILNFRLERCHMTTCKIRDDAENNEDSDVVHFEYVERKISDESLSLNPNEQLINCIKLHQQILRISQLFKNIYDNVLLPQLLISLLLITVPLLQMVLGKDGDHTDSVVAVEFLIPVILQLLTLCWGGNLSLIESDKSSNSLYEAHCYERDKEFRDNAKIFLGAVKNSLIISAGGLYDLSAVTFKNLLSKAYSGVAVLKNLNE
ncbi:odorant receptor 59b-like isoform X2 [Diachasma alloeum]|uniref:Odorant receptor n=1 Tax=Diachasma alloeum TaxID=454923 RepID=A0A4E0S4G0_9HYME|nr:odorant receptor 59b-like isoform X2 [Diachasma alloeum]THK32983.1 odorant receptor 115S [Diachasma alloeum]